MDAREQQQAALDQARRGEPEALGRLLESFRPYLLIISRALRDGRLAGRVDASDLVQDVLLEAHRSFGDFRGTTVAELAGWLRRIAIGAAHRSLRAFIGTAKRDPGRGQVANGLMEEVPDPGSSPSAQALRHEQAARVALAVSRLPEDMQEVLLGRHMEELPYALLAERMGRSEGAVRILYTRALRRLREWLIDEESDERPRNLP